MSRQLAGPRRMSVIIFGGFRGPTACRVTPWLCESASYPNHRRAGSCGPVQGETSATHGYRVSRRGSVAVVVLRTAKRVTRSWDEIARRRACAPAARAKCTALSRSPAEDGLGRLSVGSDETRARHQGRAGASWACCAYGWLRGLLIRIAARAGHFYS